MQELSPTDLGEQGHFERVERTNAGRESAPADALAELELGPDNCGAE